MESMPGAVHQRGGVGVLQWTDGGPPRGDSPSSNPLQPGNVSSFEKRVFTDAIKFRISR